VGRARGSAGSTLGPVRIDPLIGALALRQLDETFGKDLDFVE
jgi:hypothetical protein